ncbi:hypothetical protein [Alteribacter populi]|uniref:hypothetical protein n=1 Tax=Alteribacter populi TaxID=2011011 RepID=UPI000BBB1E3D|nr:hypothetical protein [Alteribacter populi]
MSWLFFVLLIVIGFLLFVNGLKNKSQILLSFGGGALIIPILYFSGVKNWFVLLPLVPAISLVISHLVMKKLNTAT